MAEQREKAAMLHSPSYRVAKAMKRITRDKWLCGEDVRKVAFALARCACQFKASAGWVAQSAIAGECTIVGMIRGRPPAYMFEPHYGEVLSAVKKIKGNLAMVPEIVLLQTVRKL